MIKKRLVEFNVDRDGRRSQNCWRGIAKLRFEPQPFIICLATKAQSHG